MPDRAEPPGWTIPWDVLDDGLRELRGCADAAELISRACALAVTCCGADQVALGRVRDGVWSPWHTASVSDDVTILVPTVPTALEELPTEREVATSGRAARRGAAERRRTNIPGVDVVVARVRSGDAVGLLHVAASGEVRLAIVEAFADALSSMFELLDVRDRVHAQERALSRMVDDVETLQHVDPIELIPARHAAADVPRTQLSRNVSGTRGLLTSRQREVLDLMLTGCSNAEIAEQMVLALPTVKSHVRAVLRAVGAVNRAEAVARLAREDTSVAFRSREAPRLRPIGDGDHPTG